MKSHDVRIWGIRKRPTKKPSYEVRWKVGDAKPFPETFRTKALADNFRAKLMRAAQNGEEFDTETGLPESMATAVTVSLTWYAFARKYLDMKWLHAAPNSRDSINETLTLVTTELLDDRPGRPDDETLRRALRGWAFVVQPEDAEPQPTEIANPLRWVEKASQPLAGLKEPAAIRRVLDSLKLTLEGAPAAAETVRRKRSVLYNALGYAVDLGELPENPVTTVKWKLPKVTKQVDRRVVVNPRQARELLAAVSYVGGYKRARGRRLVGLFACMYFGGLRPAEAVGLRRQDCTLPEKGWGSLILERTRPTVGKRWTGTDSVHDHRGLKNRAADETRVVPIPPRLVRMLRAHIEEFGTATDGRLFANERGGVVASTTYWRVWDEARRLALAPDHVASPLAGRPYDLRHAALSTWLNAGVDPTEVAERAGNSVEVLLSRYAKCLDGREDIANRRIAELLDEDDQEDDDTD
ncbi:tyrosine-type recombinase/integrase [Streptomyces palmae]|uniref:Site-specific integrase n=1 Tax=Streptomyces palmae TaxID=1701085 RepID=A0A4Z0H8B1_9ACTN|nr:tyrosine-type recombinase/integrase [Streptomyces palmae]TGB07093.1 site-specific integrase [Streptomyces palmae]